MSPKIVSQVLHQLRPGPVQYECQNPAKRSSFLVDGTIYVSRAAGYTSIAPHITTPDHTLVRPLQLTSRLENPAVSPTLAYSTAAMEPPAPCYTKDPLAVQRELIEAVDMQFLPALRAIFDTQEWILQSRPIPRRMLRALCPREPALEQCICAFCPTARFQQAGRALEHIQQHFGLRPFQCGEPAWCVVRAGPPGRLKF